ncbi:hypothetical protein [Vibrio mediterranei]|uniref:hypothetical protein n=1 Tax=Vibrio mediterranei TaxID=689 RepID=UPI0040693378
MIFVKRLIITIALAIIAFYYLYGRFPWEAKVVSPHVVELIEICHHIDCGMLNDELPSELQIAQIWQ